MGSVQRSYAGSKNKLAELNSLRGEDAKRAAMMVLSGGLNNKDLESLNSANIAAGNYNHNHTLLNAKPGNPADGYSQASKDQRDIKSEYDYGSKRKFVDVLGNIVSHKKGLDGLDDFKNHPGAKNIDQQSVRSKYSAISAKNRKSDLNKEDDVQSIVSRGN